MCVGKSYSGCEFPAYVHCTEYVVAGNWIIDTKSYMYSTMLTAHCNVDGAIQTQYIYVCNVVKKY